MRIFKGQSLCGWRSLVVKHTGTREVRGAVVLVKNTGTNEVRMEIVGRAG